jgi:copper chaperone CopZ
MSNVGTEVKSEVESSVETEKVTKDTTIVADKMVIKLITAVDNVDTKLSTKWGELIDYCVKSNLSNGTPEQLKQGKAVLLKSLIEAGKTEQSAYSIRSYILKLSKPEHKTILEDLKAGKITVRESREAGRTPQSNPSLSNEQKFERALNDAVRFAVALGYSPAKVGDAAESAFNEYLAQAEAKKAEKEAAKAAKKS